LGAAFEDAAEIIQVIEVIVIREFFTFNFAYISFGKAELDGQLHLSKVSLNTLLLYFLNYKPFYGGLGWHLGCS
jgi:hypothetical protein